MDVFGALADPTRRHIVEMLARRGSLSAGRIADEFESARPTISRHLRVLRESGLVRVTSIGQERHYVLDARPLERAEAWLSKHRRFWSARLDALDRALKEHP